MAQYMNFCYFEWVSVSVALIAVPVGAAEAPNQSAEPPPSSQPAFTLERENKSPWENGVGEGFRSTTQSFSVLLGAGLGVACFGGNEQHDLALASIGYGHMLGGAMARDHWWRGNLELRGEFFAGGQFSPSSEWIVGLTPHLRYSLATGSRWIPFLDAGAGVTATSIGPPDLSGTFEFNLQATVGVQYFFRDDLALTLEGRYLHVSCAGIHNPNAGLNSVLGFVGLTWCF
jgi:hypothetical protein